MFMSINNETFKKRLRKTKYCQSQDYVTPKTPFYPLTHRLKCCKTVGYQAKMLVKKGEKIFLKKFRSFSFTPKLTLSGVPKNKASKTKLMGACRKFYLM